MSSRVMVGVGQMTSVRAGMDSVAASDGYTGEKAVTYVLLSMLDMATGSDVVIPLEVRVLTAEWMGRCRLRYAYNGLGLIRAFEARLLSYCLVADLMATLVVRARCL